MLESNPDEQWEDQDSLSEEQPRIPATEFTDVEEEDHDGPEPKGTPTTTCSGQTSKPYKHYEPTLAGQSYSHLQHEKVDTCKYDNLTAKAIASIMVELSE